VSEGTVTSLDDPLAAVSRALAENLAGRRVLPRAETGIDGGRALLAQMEAARRVRESLDRMSSCQHPLKEVCERMTGDVVAALVAEIAQRPDLRVAAWKPAQRAYEALADLLEQLEAACAAPTGEQDDAASR
jgi:hypothetical protein